MWPHSDSGLRQYCEDFSFHRIVALSRLKTLPGRATGSLSTGLFVSIRVVVLAEARTAEAPTGRWRSYCDSGPSAFCPAIPSGLRRAGQTGTWSRQRSPAGRRRSAAGSTPLRMVGYRRLIRQMMLGKPVARTYPIHEAAAAGRRRSADSLTSLANTREGGNPECPDGLWVCHTVIPWQGRRRRGVEPEEAPADAGNRHIREGPCARLSAVLSKGGPHG